MIKDALASFDQIHLTVIAMCLFIGAFVGVSVRALMTRPSDEASRIANLPLQNEETTP